MRLAACFLLTCVLFAAAPQATFAQENPCRHLEGEERERCRAEQRGQRQEQPQRQQPPQQQQQQTQQPSESWQEERRRERERAREEYRRERAGEEQRQQQQTRQQQPQQGSTANPSASQRATTTQPYSSTPSGPTGGYPYWDRQPDLEGGCDDAVDEWGFCYRECTSYVAWKLNNAAGRTFFTNRMRNGRWGNASNWVSNARNLSYTVNNSPSVGSIAWFSYGHVAYVERVNSNGTVEISEYNYHTRTAPHTFGRRTLSSSDVGAFIHLSQSTPSTPQQTTNPFPLPTIPNNTANTTPQTIPPRAPTATQPTTPAVRALSVSGISSRYTPSRAPHTEVINLRGEALDTVREIRWSWSGANNGSTTWRRGEGSWSSRFVASSDGRTATVRPVLIAANDPAGRYDWTVTFYGEGSPVSRNFRVEFGEAESSSAVELSIDNIRDITASSAPYQRTISLSGAALNTITEIRWTWSGPNSGSSIWRRSDSSWSSRFSAPSDGRSATVRPTLLAANDPTGRYNWTVTFSGGGLSVTKRFQVEYRR